MNKPPFNQQPGIAVRSARLGGGARPVAPGVSEPTPAFPSLTFPKDRTMLYVFEVAARLRVSQQHVVNLIEEGKLRALNIGGANPKGRRCYRIPVEAWETFVRENLL